jgi:hypothetical protein
LRVRTGIVVARIFSRKNLLAFASVFILLAPSAIAQRAAAAPDDGISIPCALPADAVTSVPAPFDRYMALACTSSGQALKPQGGFVALNNISMWLTSNSPDKRDLAPSTHFTGLSLATLTPEQVAAFRAEMSKAFDSPLIRQAAVYKLDEETSGGARKQIYLLIAPEGSNAPALGIECVNDCVPLEQKPWAFLIVPKQP